MVMDRLGQNNGGRQFANFFIRFLVEHPTLTKIRKMKYSLRFLCLQRWLATSCIIRSTAQPLVICGASYNATSAGVILVSATDPMQFFADAPLSPNMRKQITKRATTACVRDRLTTRKIIRSGGWPEQIPANETARHFEAPELGRSAVTFFAHPGANHLKLMKSEDRS